MLIEKDMWDKFQGSQLSRNVPDIQFFVYFLYAHLKESVFSLLILAELPAVP